MFVDMTDLKINDDNVTWYELNGIDYGTDVEFECDVYGLTVDGDILDCDGAPLYQGFEKIAVNNTLNKDR